MLIQKQKGLRHSRKLVRWHLERKLRTLGADADKRAVAGKKVARVVVGSALFFLGVIDENKK